MDGDGADEVTAMVADDEGVISTENGPRDIMTVGFLREHN
jgi:hypothetical protein